MTVFHIVQIFNKSWAFKDVLDGFGDTINGFEDTINGFEDTIDGFEDTINGFDDILTSTTLRNGFTIFRAGTSSAFGMAGMSK